MALNTNPTPYGLNDIKLTNLANTVQVDLPNALTLTFKERVKSAEGMGDDKIVTVVSVLEAVEWELEATGLPLEALALMAGIATSTTGTTPDQVKTMNRAGATKYPYFLIYGKSLGDGDDDVHCIIYKAKVTEGLDSALKYGELQNSKIKGIGIDDGTNGIYDWVENETADTLPAASGSTSALSLTPVPADNATGVNVADNIVLTFNNALARGAENSIIILRVDTDAVVSAVRTISANRKVVTLNPASSLAAATEHYVIVAGVTDIYGQSLADTVVSFTTA